MKNTLHKGYILGILLKGVEGVFELTMAIVLNFVTLESLRGTLVGYSLSHLAYDPDDWFATHLLHLAQQISLPMKLFTTAYLFAHGVLRLFMFITLMKKKQWAFPVAMLLLALFFLYQCYHLTTHFSWGFVLLSTVDPGLLVLVYIEYRHLFPGQPLLRRRSTQPAHP